MVSAGKIQALAKKKDGVGSESVKFKKGDRKNGWIKNTGACGGGGRHGCTVGRNNST